MDDPRRKNRQGGSPNKQKPTQALAAKGSIVQADAADETLSLDLKPKKRKKTFIILLCCAVALIVCVLVYAFISEQQRAAEEAAAKLAAEEALRQQLALERLEFERFANSTIFLEGITIDEVDIGNMTLDDARTALKPAVAAYQPSGNLQLTYAQQHFFVDLSKVRATCNLDDVLSEAYRLGKTGDYTAMKAEIEDIRESGRHFTLEASYDFSGIKEDVLLISEELDTEPEDAAVSGVNSEERAFDFSDGVTGVIVLQDELTKAIIAAIPDDMHTPIAIPVLEIPPTVTKEDLAARYVLRGKATTSFKSSDSNRIANIVKGCALISGTVLKPDEVFSTNSTLGMRTSKNGWKLAGAYKDGMIVKEAGGGVCQLSSTLYNTVVKSDLMVVSRRNHSMPVFYISDGLDATINSVGNVIDFTFRNSTSSDIVIFGYIKGMDVTFEIWGLPFSTDEYDEIRLTSKKVKTLNPDGPKVEIEVPEGTVKPDGSKMVAGETFIYVARRDGSTWQSYINYYKNGVLVRTEPLALSTYKAMAGETWICLAIGAPPPTEIEPPEPPGPGIIEP